LPDTLCGILPVAVLARPERIIPNVETKRMEVTMRRIMSLIAAGPALVAALWLLSAAAPAIAKDSCHGTTIVFEDTPSKAARKAVKEEKLVFVLHVSGHFEDPRFT
jgi:hypothetical protein